MSVKAMHWAFQQRLQPRDKVVLLALADCANDQGICFPSHKLLAEKTCLSRRTVIRVLSGLEDAGLLAKEARNRDDGGDSSNVYRLAWGECQSVTPECQDVTGGSDSTVTGGVSAVSPHMNHHINQELSEDSSLPAKRVRRGVRWQGDVPADWRAWARSDRPEIDADLEAEKFRDYWIARPGREALKLDWEATWRNWIRNAKGYGHGRNEPASVMRAIGR